MTKTNNEAAALKNEVIRTRLAYIAALAAHAAALPPEPVPAPEHTDAEGHPTDAFFDTPEWVAFEEADEAAHGRFRVSECFRAQGAAEDALIDWSFDVMKRGGQTSFAFRRIAGVLERGRQNHATRAKLADLALQLDGVPQ
jgi:hypothetical protein